MVVSIKYEIYAIYETVGQLGDFLSSQDTTPHTSCSFMKNLSNMH